MAVLVSQHVGKVNIIDVIMLIHSIVMSDVLNVERVPIKTRTPIKVKHVKDAAHVVVVLSCLLLVQQKPIERVPIVNLDNI